MKTVDAAVIGGGPGGMAAATEAARRGASVALVEESANLGGKVLKTASHGPPLSPIERHEKRIANRLLADLHRQSARITILSRHQVWHIQDGRTLELSATGGGPLLENRIRCRRLVIAPGAMERIRPFPGWTLPGVFTLGGLNTFVKHGVSPGKRFVIAGSGPLLPVLAHNLVRAGCEIAALVQTIPARKALRHAIPMVASMDPFKAFQGLFYMAQILRKRVPVYSGAAVCRVDGEDRAESVRIIRIGRNGKPVPGTEIDIPAEAVAVGCGLIPCPDLTRLCGCREVYEKALGYWRVERNELMETSVKGVFTAGDGATIKGYEAAALEGRLAGAAAAVGLGYGPDREDGWAGIQKKLEKSRRFGRILDALSAPEPGLLDLITDDTIICRCEETRMRDIRRAAAEGARDIHEIKRRTRTGMGQCQGRFCGQVVNELLWELLWELSLESPGEFKNRKRDRFTPRLPAKPVPLGQLIADP